MSEIELFYLASAVLFIIGLRRLSTPRTARGGNTLASLGMGLAVVVTLIDQDIMDWPAVIAGVAVGGVVGALLALRVQMTAMPQLVAAFNGFGGAASALVALGQLTETDGVFTVETGVTVVLSLAIGSVTFTGSFIAFGKLQGIVSGRPIGLPGGHAVNALLAAATAGLGVWAVAADEPVAFWLVVLVTAILGVLAVLPIGGADMPVVISLLNSLSGVAAAMAGFVISNTALIIGGALVGAAGFILTVIMAEGMNRTLAHVLCSRASAPKARRPAR